jgi:large subunit ribosomal protein L9
MRVIFLKDVPRVGNRNDVKDVNDGYAMNFLFPSHLAEPATKSAVAKLEMKKKEVVIERKVQESLLVKNLAELKGKTVIIETKADEKGHLFSGIHKKEIIEQMSRQHHVEISEDFIVLEKPIKEVGECDILVEVSTQKGKSQKASFRLLVREV